MESHPTELGCQIKAGPTYECVRDNAVFFTNLLNSEFSPRMCPPEYMILWGPPQLYIFVKIPLSKLRDYVRLSAKGENGGAIMSHEGGSTA